MAHSVVKTIEFDYGHRVANHKSKCSSVHGHRGRVEVTVEGPLGSAGSGQDMVFDFGDIKLALAALIDRFDHNFIIAQSDTDLMSLIGMPVSNTAFTGFGRLLHMPYFGKVQEISGISTAENLAYLCYRHLAGVLDNPVTGMHVAQVAFYETPSSLAIYVPD